MPESGYKVWAVDDVIYGPVDLTRLIEWIKDERVTSSTWIFDLADQKFATAGKMSQLGAVFQEMPDTKAEKEHEELDANLKAGMLRRIRVLDGLSDDDMTAFANRMKIARFGRDEKVLAQGSDNNAMYLIAEGEVAIFQNTGGVKIALATLGAGEFFGDISLFDSGPCSADAVAAIPSIFIRITQSDLNGLKDDHPAAVAGFLRNLAHAMVRRIRLDNRRFEKTVRAARKGI